MSPTTQILYNARQKEKDMYIFQFSPINKFRKNSISIDCRENKIPTLSNPSVSLLIQMRDSKMKS